MFAELCVTRASATVTPLTRAAPPRAPSAPACGGIAGARAMARPKLGCERVDVTGGGGAGGERCGAALGE
jgi:hypothetical protein